MATEQLEQKIAELEKLNAKLVNNSNHVQNVTEAFLKNLLLHTDTILLKQATISRRNAIRCLEVLQSTFRDGIESLYRMKKQNGEA